MSFMLVYHKCTLYILTMCSIVAMGTSPNPWGYAEATAATARRHDTCKFSYVWSVYMISSFNMESYKGHGIF